MPTPNLGRADMLATMHATGLLPRSRAVADRDPVGHARRRRVIDLTTGHPVSCRDLRLLADRVGQRLVGPQHLSRAPRRSSTKCDSSASTSSTFGDDICGDAQPRARGATSGACSFGLAVAFVLGQVRIPAEDGRAILNALYTVPKITLLSPVPHHLRFQGQADHHSHRRSPCSSSCGCRCSTR